VRVKWTYVLVALGFLFLSVAPAGAAGPGPLTFPVVVNRPSNATPGAQPISVTTSKAAAIPECGPTGCYY